MPTIPIKKRRSPTTRRRMSRGWYEKRMHDTDPNSLRVNVRLSASQMSFLRDLCEIRKQTPAAMLRELLEARRGLAVNE
jgi:hypothetical protein